MLYNDEETRNEEKKFQERLKLARSFTKDEKQKLMGSLNILFDAVKKLATKPALTEEEAALLIDLKAKMATLIKNIEAMQDALGENLLRQSYAYYHHIKGLAEKGNADAQKIYEDLKPSYQESLKSNIGDN